ncbi:MAG: ABC transporter permease, partial [Paenibacillaceae bacterium]
MNQLMKLFGANFKITFREKQVWFWSIFYPVFLLIVFLTIFGGMGSGDDDSFSAEIAVVTTQVSETSEQMEQILRHISVLKWKDEQTVSRDQAEEWLKDKDIEAVIVLPDGVASKEVELIFNREKEQSASTQVISGIMSSMLGDYNVVGAPVTPEYALSVDYVSSGDDDVAYSDFLLTGMIALSISQAGLFGMVGMVEMRRNGLLKRLRMTPVNMNLFGLSNMLVRFILSAIQIILLTLIGLLFYNANLDFDILAFVLMFIVGTLAFAAMGYMVAAFSKSIESFMGIVNLISFLMMFLSGIFFDYTLLPSWLKPLADALPLTYFVNGIRDSMVYGISMIDSSFWLNIGVLLGWTLVTFAIGSRFY